MHLLVGTNRLRGGPDSATPAFDFVELGAEVGTLPRPGRLAEWAEKAPEGFGFAIALPRLCSSLDTTPEAEKGWVYALRAAHILEARWIVLSTPASVTPTTRNRARLAALAERVPVGHGLVWQPSGLWEPEDAANAARMIGATVAVDLSRGEPPPGGIVYGRLPRLGGSGGVSMARVERVARTVLERDEAWVVIEEPGAVAGARALRREVEGALAEIQP